VVFRLPETSLGLVPAQMAPFLVERLGYAEAKRLAVTGARLDAPRRWRCAWCTRCTPTRALDAALQRCWPRSCAARRARWRHQGADRARRAHSPASLVHEAAEAFRAAALGPEGHRRHAGLPAKSARRSWVPQ
jgi:isohexenylglutaconyl-CoA hydratase